MYGAFFFGLVISYWEGYSKIYEGEFVSSLALHILMLCYWVYMCLESLCPGYFDFFFFLKLYVWLLLIFIPMFFPLISLLLIINMSNLVIWWEGRINISLYFF